MNRLNRFLATLLMLCLSSGARAFEDALPPEIRFAEVDGIAMGAQTGATWGLGFMRSSCEEEGRRKLLFKSTWSTVSDGVKRISGP